MIEAPVSPVELAELSRQVQQLPWRRSVSRSKNLAKAFLRGNYVPGQEYVREKDISCSLVWMMAKRCPTWKADGWVYRFRLHGGILRRWPDTEANSKLIRESRRAL